MDASLAFIDPNSIQWNQLLEDDELPSTSSAVAGSATAAETNLVADNVQEAIFDLTPLSHTEQETTSEKDNEYLCSSIVEAEAKIRDVSQRFDGHYRKRKLPRNFGNSDWRSVLVKKKLFNDDNLLFIKAANDSCIYECDRGPDWDKQRKTRRRKEHQEQVIRNSRPLV
jgi:hypothetical protein